MRAAAVALACSLLEVASAAAPPTNRSLPVADLAIGPGARILIVAPHPDDEALCCAGFIQRAVAAGSSVSIVWVTSGDAFELDAALVEKTLLPGHSVMLRLASDRMREAGRAADLLAVAAADRWFLGYPDRGLRPLLTDFYARPYTSHYTGASAVPYANALVPGSSYEGRLLVRDLGTVLDRVRPTLVLAPSSLDRHRDHAAVGELVSSMLPERGAGADVRYWVIHAGRSWPSPRRFVPTGALQPPPGLRDLDWSVWPLTVPEREGKLAVLRAYRSQWQIMEPFLVSFARNNEIFTTQPWSRLARRTAAPEGETQHEDGAQHHGHNDKTAH